jgi:hypothetical protein
MKKEDHILRRVFIVAGLLLLLLISSAAKRNIEKNAEAEKSINDAGPTEVSSQAQEPEATQSETGTTEDEPTATYTITFTGSWSEMTHPIDFPSNPHFSPLVAVTHNQDFNLFRVKEPATSGIQSMAETGKTKLLLDEIMSGSKGANLAVATGSRIDSPGITSIQIMASQEHNLISLVSMIAPSPDWFVALSDIQLYDANSGWLDSSAVTLGSFDAGTDSGETYTSEDLPSENQVITEIKSPPPFASISIMKN